MSYHDQGPSPNPRPAPSSRRTTIQWHTLSPLRAQSSGLFSPPRHREYIACQCCKGDRCAHTAKCTTNVHLLTNRITSSSRNGKHQGDRHRMGPPGGYEQMAQPMEQLHGVLAAMSKCHSQWNRSPPNINTKPKPKLSFDSARQCH